MFGTLDVEKGRDRASSGQVRFALGPGIEFVELAKRFERLSGPIERLERCCFLLEHRGQKSEMLDLVGKAFGLVQHRQGTSGVARERLRPGCDRQEIDPRTLGEIRVVEIEHALGCVECIDWPAEFEEGSGDDRLRRRSQHPPFVAERIGEFDDILGDDHGLAGDGSVVAWCDGPRSDPFEGRLRGVEAGEPHPSSVSELLIDRCSLLERPQSLLAVVVVLGQHDPDAVQRAGLTPTVPDPALDVESLLEVRERHRSLPGDIVDGRTRRKSPAQAQLIVGLAEQFDGSELVGERVRCESALEMRPPAEVKSPGLRPSIPAPIGLVESSHGEIRRSVGLRVGAARGLLDLCDQGLGACGR